MNQCMILTGNQLIVIYSYKYDVKLIDEDHKIINIYLIYLEANLCTLISTKYYTIMYVLYNKA
jgi:hypothetical protein